jgi:NADH-quinone oxidoreductase subunit L
MIPSATSSECLLLWTIPALPALAAAVITLLPARSGNLAARISIFAQGFAAVLALAAMSRVLPGAGPGFSSSHEWLRVDALRLPLGLLLDPLSGGMLAMVAFVAFWIFVYASGYMKHDPRRTRFHAFLCLFSSAMLLLVLSNSLLQLFMAWEIVGLASYLLIGFHHIKPSAAAAARKAFLTTRIGDLLFLFGLLWLHRQTGTLLLHDHGKGLLETGALDSLAAATAGGGLAVSTVSSLLLFGGAMGKSGQMPLHSWLPDAMEGPTPVSALIHAATMVAAGVFLVARAFPIFTASLDADGLNPALMTTAWIGAGTALLAAMAATAQHDLKRLLAWSTISQLGFMMIALGTGGVAAAMFHLIAHAFFKALLFLSAGSVIHGCHDEQDMRKLGGLARKMPRTFAVYAIGMMALAGFPFLFSGFWSKEAILHSAGHWAGGKGPFLLAIAAAVLTASYMTRQALTVFFGNPRGRGADDAHESPPVMIVPMVVLAAGAVLLSMIATPVWPWFEAWLNGHEPRWNPAALAKPDNLKLMGLSILIVLAGCSHAWWAWKRDPAAERDGTWKSIRAEGFHFDRAVEKSLAPALTALGTLAHWLDRVFFVPLLALIGGITRWSGQATTKLDDRGLNAGFDASCDSLNKAGDSGAKSQRAAAPQAPLRLAGFTLALLFLIFLLLTRWHFS